MNPAFKPAMLDSPEQIAVYQKHQTANLLHFIQVFNDLMQKSYAKRVNGDPVSYHESIAMEQAIADIDKCMSHLEELALGINGGGPMKWNL